MRMANLNGEYGAVRPSDDGNTKDGDGCSAKCAKEAPKLAKGDLVITEIMIKSVSGTDNGEWFEVHNKTGQNLDLNGIVVASKAAEHTIDGKGKAVMLNAGGWIVLGRSLDKVENGDTPVAYGYGNLAMGNSGGEVVLLSGGVEIDRVDYGVATPWPGAATGKSMQLHQSKLDDASNDLGESWCLSGQGYGNKGMSGTPGMSNSCP